MPAVPIPSMLGRYLGTAPPSADDQTAMDAFGNRNGRFDLGDVRVHLRTQAAAG